MTIRVLIVEDDEADAEFVRRQFRQLGPEFSLDRVASIEEAQALQDSDADYQLILLDLGLPGTYRLSALQSVSAVFPQLPIIVLTGNDDEVTALAALREGAQDYLVKGKSGADTLVRAVRYALERGRLQTERAALERKLAHSQRLEALGRLAGGIAHEINNRLTPIIGMAECQTALLPEGDKLRAMAATILTAAEDASALVRNLLTYARHQPDAAMTTVDLGDIMEHAAVLTRATLPPTVRLHVEVAAGVPPLRGNPTRLLTLVLNLVSNAVDAMSCRTGGITFSLAAVDGREVESAANPPLIHSRYLRLIVQDDGIGMDEDTLARAFDPFFTSKAVDKGSGLGLSVVHGIVLDHQGAIAVSSTPGQGTEVQVFLPVCE